jgi:hypothetical protein
VGYFQRLEDKELSLACEPPGGRLGPCDVVIAP